MNRTLMLYIFLSTFFTLHGQDYFQQKVDYDIKVKLIDSTHTLEGLIEINYTNQSPDDLDIIYMHLWGNAFKNRNTAFVKQKLRNFDTDFYFADETEYGGYSELDFSVDDKQVAWKLDEKHLDIAILKLDTPIKSGETVKITTPFTLQIPQSYSRLGHVGTSYQMTQWYPKPAVYDRNGWHPMPYLDMGEFYSEFGDFKVEITLPANYYVGATGELTTESERKFIDERVTYTTSYLKDSLTQHTDFPPSSESQKTIRYTAENVHDFAWFADKRFLIQKDTAVLASGRTIDCWSYFTDFEINLWRDADFYVKRAVEFYSARVGAYPYPQATAVQSALSAGAGMEYPMITVIGASGQAPSLDQVITHEVGHNWFYGILASNERDHPWMDEGMNSYHDHKYTSIYYENFDEFGGVLPQRIRRQMEYSPLNLIYQIWARLGKDQAPNTSSDDLTMVNYFLGAYEKPAISFKILEEYLGEQAFVEAMKNYYDAWAFRHPSPDDVKVSFEESTGKNLDWLFDGLLYSNAVYDYQIKKRADDDGSLLVENKGQVAAPLSVTLFKDSTDFKTIWFDGFLGEKEIEIESLDGYEVEVDKQRISLDIDPANNDLSNGKPALKFLTGLKTSKRNKLFYFPLLGANVSNLAEIGLMFHNYGVPLSNFQYYIMPMIGTRKGEVIGAFEFRRDFPKREGMLRNISIALGGKSFHEDYNERFDYNLRFSRIQPSIDFEWKSKLVSPVSHFLTYRPLGIITETEVFSPEGMFEGKNQNFALIHDLSYQYVRRSPINALKGEVHLEYQRYNRPEESHQYLKLYGEVNGKYAYKRRKFIEIRAFGGFFPFHSERDISTSAAIANFSMFYRGFNDYRYDRHYIDRTGQEGFLTRQVAIADGGFKNGLTNSMPLGLSNNYMASINLSADLPFDWTRRIPIKPYFDAGVYSYKPTTSEPFRQEVLWSGGLMIDFQKVMMIHFPLFNSDQINDVYVQTADNFWQRVSFTINLNELNPHRLKYWFYR